MARILVVDDDPEIRSTLKRLLELRDHSVLVANDGRAAETALAGEEVDLMITDIVMPNQDGIECIRTTRAAHPQVPIIAISGGGRLRTENYLRLAKAMGATEVFQKPFDFEDLAEAVERALAQTD